MSLTAKGSRSFPFGIAERGTSHYLEEIGGNKLKLVVNAARGEDSFFAADLQNATAAGLARGDIIAAIQHALATSEKK